MKNKRVFIAAPAVVAILFAGILIVKHTEIFSSGAKNTSSTSGKSATGRKILYYRAPMNPNYISDKPGKSPMGMDLVPVYEGEEAPPGTVKIDPTVVQNIGVRTATAEKRVLKREIRTVGRVTYDEEKVSYINTKIGGWIEKLYVNYEGGSVNKGDPLYAIYSPELVATQEEYLLALEYEKQMEKSGVKEIGERAGTLLDSAEKRLAYWDISQKSIDELKDTGEVKKAMVIDSPVSGVVINKDVLEGQFVKPGENLYRIADLSKVWIYADIYEYELPWVKTGQKAEIALSYLPGKTFDGTITYIYPFLENKTRTARVRLELENPSGELKPDMYANVRINTAPTKPVLAVPREAVIPTGERNIIIIARGHGFFEPRNVSIGMRTRDFLEILSGVKEGEKVVTSAQFLIDSESQLNEAINNMLKNKKASAETTAVQPGKKEMKMTSGAAAESEDATKAAMDRIWNAYFYLRKQLAMDSMARFSRETDIIRDDVTRILSADSNKEVKAIAGKIQASLTDITSRDIIRVRDGFWKMSEAMIDYMKNLDKEEAKENGYKLFYCGVKKRSWVQKDDKIGNPYVGAKLAATCAASETY